MVEHDFELATSMDGAGVGFEIKTLDDIEVFRVSHDVTQFQVWCIGGESDSTAGTTCGYEPTCLGEAFGDFDEVIG